MKLSELKKLSGRHEAGSREWFSVRAGADGEPAEIYIYDEIGMGWYGGGVDPKNLIDEIKDLKLKDSESLRVRINSPGGDMFDGNTIYNYLRSMKNKISVRVDGVAASAASIIAMAGDTVEMPENSFLMIHNPWMLVAGDSHTMRKAADDLDEIGEGAVKTYLRRTDGKVERDELVQMLDDETWLSADRAVELGFADEILEPVKAAAFAGFDYSLFQHVPEPIMKAKRALNVVRFQEVKNHEFLNTR